MLDTNYWISLRYSSAKRERFTELVINDEIEVYFSYGNFIDLAQAVEQDELSKILADTVDTYVPSMNYEGNTYVTTDNPIGLIPDAEVARSVRQQTAGRSEEASLREIFRVSDWNPDSDWYTNYTQTLKDIYDEHGFEYAMVVSFRDYLNYEEEVARLREQEIDVTEYVRKMASLHRIETIQDNEKIDSNDIADIEICSQAILTECDMLLIESKWRNLRLVEKVTNKLDSEETVEVFDDFDEFLDALDTYLADI